MHVKDIVKYDGTGTDGPAILIPLAAAQKLVGKRGSHQLRAHLQRRRRRRHRPRDQGDGARPRPRPASRSSPPSRTRSRRPTRSAASIMITFTTFGTFSVVAGILLIFLIFVMLAAERKTEMGVSRAIGTQRTNLIQMFLFEGVAYDLAAAAVGRAAGRRRRLRDGDRDGRRARELRLQARARPARTQHDHRLHARRADHARRRHRLRMAGQRRSTSCARSATCPSRSCAAADAAASSSAAIAWALRRAPDLRRRRRHAGRRRSTSGVSLVIIGAIPMLRALRAPERVAYTVPAVALDRLVADAVLRHRVVPSRDVARTSRSSS